METVHFSKMLASTNHSTWHQNPEKHHRHHRENVKPHTSQDTLGFYFYGQIQKQYFKWKMTTTLTLLNLPLIIIWLPTECYTSHKNETTLKQATQIWHIAGLPFLSTCYYKIYYSAVLEKPQFTKLHYITFLISENFYLTSHFLSFQTPT